MNLEGGKPLYIIFDATVSSIAKSQVYSMDSQNY